MPKIGCQNRVISGVFSRTSARKSSFRTKNNTDKANFRCAADKKYYSDFAPSYGIVQKWFTEFRSVCTSTETIPSPVCPNEITAPEMINKIHNIVLNDQKVKVREIAEIVSISTERMINILHRQISVQDGCRDCAQSSENGTICWKSHG